jgi:hypothetical protein
VFSIAGSATLLNVVGDVHSADESLAGANARDSDTSPAMATSSAEFGAPRRLIVRDSLRTPIVRAVTTVQRHGPEGAQSDRRRLGSVQGWAPWRE